MRQHRLGRHYAKWNKLEKVYYLHVESKKMQLVNKTNKKQTHRYTELVVISRQREGGSNHIEMKGEKVIMRLYEIIYVKPLKIVKHEQI